MFDRWRRDRRVARARAAIAEARYAAALDALDDLVGDDAAALRRDARRGLARINLELVAAAVARRDAAAAAKHWALAVEHDTGDLADRFAEVRRAARAAGLAWRPPADPADEEAAFRAWLAGWPDVLRPGVEALAERLRPIVAVAEDRPDLALQALWLLSDREPAVRWLRARVSLALGDRAAAIRELRAFAGLVGGYPRVGDTDTARWLADVLVAHGDTDAAARVLRDAGG